MFHQDRTHRFARCDVLMATALLEEAVLLCVIYEGYYKYITVSLWWDKLRDAERTLPCGVASFVSR